MVDRFGNILACTAVLGFLLVGGLGAGARASLCIKANGSVQVETIFNRCCGDECDSIPRPDEQQRGSSECGPCVDVPLTGESHVLPSSRVTTDEPVAHLAQAAPAAWGHSTHLENSGAMWGLAWHGSCDSEAPLRAQILRC